MEKATFYWEWVSLPKAEFNILAMLAEQGGSFCGNYADMCRYLNVTSQSKNRAQLKHSIESLSSKGLLEWKECGRTQKLMVVPKATAIALDRQLVRSVIRHDYTSEQVAFAQVLKVFVWIVHNKMEVVTNMMIADELGISESTVVSAKNVLIREYENVSRKKISEKIGKNRFRTLGQELEASAIWSKL